MGGKKKGSGKELGGILTSVGVLIVTMFVGAGVGAGLFSQLDTTYMVIGIIIWAITPCVLLASIIFFTYRFYHEFTMERFKKERKKFGFGKFQVVVESSPGALGVDPTSSIQAAQQAAAAAPVLLMGSGGAAPPNAVVPMMGGAVAPMMGGAVAPPNAMMGAPNPMMMAPNPNMVPMVPGQEVIVMAEPEEEGEV